MDSLATLWFHAGSCLVPWLPAKQGAERQSVGSQGQQDPVRSQEAASEPAERHQAAQHVAMEREGGVQVAGVADSRGG